MPSGAPTPSLSKSHRGTIPLLHMAMVHQGPQFVIAATVDYDPLMSADAVDRQMEACGDFGLPRSMRKHARFWSAREYRDAIMRGLSGIFAQRISRPQASSGSRAAAPVSGVMRSCMRI